MLVKYVRSNRDYHIFNGDGKDYVVPKYDTMGGSVSPGTIGTLTEYVNPHGLTLYRVSVH